MTAAPVLQLTRARAPRGSERFGAALWRSTSPQLRPDLLRAGDRFGDRRLVAALPRVPAAVRGALLEHLVDGPEAGAHMALRLACAGALEHLGHDVTQSLLLFMRGPSAPGLAERWQEGAMRIAKGLLRRSLSPRATAEGLAEAVVDVICTPRVPLYVLEAQGPWPRGLVVFGPPEASASPSVGEWRAGAAPVLRAPDPCIEAGWPDVHPISREAYVGVRYVLTCAEAAEIVGWLDREVGAMPRRGGPRLARRARELVGASLGQTGARVRFAPGEGGAAREG